MSQLPGQQALDPAPAPAPSPGAGTDGANRRAAKACSCCHTRKIRCDLGRVGFPCTKCRADGFECVLHSRKKRARRGVVAYGGGRGSSGGSAPPPASRPIPEHIMLHKFPYYPFFRKLAAQGRGQDHGVLLPIPAREQSAAASLHADDIQFLKHKGALDLPPQRVLDQCVETYFRVFHPFFPVVDKPAFLAQYRQTDRDAILSGAAGPSLLLLQAVVFIASAAIPIQIIHDLGFSSRVQARSCFHRRTRYLYEFDYESDDIVIIQALLLMSQHYPSLVEQKHTWLWVHQAIGLAQGAGLHRDSGPGPHRKLWARIWWACLTRDRLITLGTGRPMHINSLDCSVPLLATSDLEEEGDTEDDRIVKAIFVEFVKLCQYMEGVLSLPLVAAEGLQVQVSVCEATLESWVANLDPPAQRGNSPPLESTQRDVPTMYRAILHLIYNTVLIALRQSGRILEEGRGAVVPRTPAPDVQSAADDTASLAHELVSQDLVRFCPTICVTTILPALVVHIRRMRSMDNELEGEPATAAFHHCMGLLKKLGEIYWHAGFYHDFFQLAAPNSQPPSASSNLASGVLPGGIKPGRQAGMGEPIRPNGGGIKRKMTAQSQTEMARRSTRANRSAVEATGASVIDNGEAVVVAPDSSTSALLPPTTRSNQPALDNPDPEQAAFLQSEYQLVGGWLDDMDDYGMFQSLFPSA